MEKIRKNQMCSCGSKLKYKRCCFDNKKTKKTNHDSIITKARKMGLEHSSTAIQASIDILKPLIDSGKLKKDDGINAKLGLVSAYQRQGRHKNAISVLEGLKEDVDKKSELEIYSLHQLAISYAALKYTGPACEIYKHIFSIWEAEPATTKLERRVRGAILLEAGKAFSENDENKKAIECWERSAELLREFEKEEAENIGRTQANIAFSMLKSDQENEQEEGVKRVQLSTNKKLKIGDLKGVANNYCNLGTYFLHKKRFGRALSNYRHDLHISRLVGDKRDIASTIGNIASLYVELKQFKFAKQYLAEAKSIGEELGDEALLHITGLQLDIVNSRAREAATSKTPTGEKAICSCGSNDMYVDCCGTADYEPVSIPNIYGGFSEDALKIHDEMLLAGKTASPLDFILRTLPDGKVRKSWSEHEVRDGWVIMKELPDMASIHLIAAKEMVEKAVEANDLTSSVSAVILSVCHLEAFINQLSFFLHQNMGHRELTSMAIPQTLIDDGPLNYQRKGNLEIKWQQIADCLTFPGWLEKQLSWQETKDLIYIRNELVHFKAADYEQVVPAARKKAIIYSKIPSNITLRDEPHSWPFKILTADLAKWAVQTTETLVSSLKAAYSCQRVRNINGT